MTSDADRIDGYAAAVLSVARAEGDQSGLSDQLFQVAQAIDGSEELRDALTNPRIPFDRKKAIVDDLLGTRTSAVVVNVVELLVANGRTGEMGEIARRALDLAAASEEAVVAEVRSAVELDAATLDRLTAKLEAVTGKNIQPTVIVDPKLVGGVVAKVGDTVFDGSVASRLQELREAWG
jgi:F-type H+-transporting ATPase subunit delta